MRTFTKLALSLALPAAGLLAIHEERPAYACGGCFVPADENSQVTGHRMLVSISNEQTTLWDQFSYSGDPASFAWVLPIKGLADIGLSSDLVFATLGVMTQPYVVAPDLCPPPPECWWEQGPDAGSGGAGGGSGNGVEVIAQEVVGPFATAQLDASDPNALRDWLDQNGYSVPSEIDPVIDAYVAEDWNFLVMKLVPGASVDQMRPVRVTTPGAGIGLPLRMVAAGTGAFTPITLFVLGEGRYEAENYPNALIDEAALVWDFDTSSSNFVEVRQSALDAQGGHAWVTESARAAGVWEIESTIQNVIDFQPELSGYGDATGQGAQQEFEEDLGAMVGTLDMSALWVSRLYANMPQASLTGDLMLTSAAQTPVSNAYFASSYTGTPQCFDYPCSDGGGGAGGGATGGAGPGFGGSGGATGVDPGDVLVSKGGGCAVGSSDTTSAGAMGLGLVALGWLARRRRDAKGALARRS